MGDFEKNESRRGMLSSGFIKTDFSYFSQWIGRIKLMQLVSVLLAGCLLPSTPGVFFTRFSFYVFVTWTTFMYVAIDLLLHVTSLWRRLPTATCSSLLVFLDAIAALVWLICSSLVASVARYVGGNGTTFAAISCVFGFVTTILFLVEAFFQHVNVVPDTRHDESDDEDDGNRPPIYKASVSRPSAPAQAGNSSPYISRPISRDMTDRNSSVML